MQHPTIEKITKQSKKYGYIISDNYAWMRDEEWPNVRSEKILHHLKKENQYTESYFEGIKNLEKSIYKELEKKIDTDKKSLEIPQGKYYYYTKTKKGLNYPIHYRRKLNSDEEEIILDINLLAKGKKFCSINCISICPEGKYLTYSVDYVGDERTNTHIINLDNNKKIQDIIKNSSSIVWHNNVKGFFYLEKDQDWRTKKCYFHVLGKKKEEDILVYHEKRKTFSICIRSSTNDKFLFLFAKDGEGDEIYCSNLNNDIKTYIIKKYQQNIRCDIEHNDTNFFLCINDKGNNYRVIKISEESILNNRTENFKEYIPCDKEIFLDGIDFTKNYMLLNYKKYGIPLFKVIDLRNKKEKYVNTFSNQEVFTGKIFCRHYESDEICLTYSSLASDTKYFTYSFKENKLQYIHKNTQKNLINSDEYIVKRIFADNQGIKIPITIFMQKKAKINGISKLVLYGYGSYGIEEYTGYSVKAHTLVENGFIYAIAHIRGGSHLGEQWYQDAKFLDKKNTFLDFIACSKALIEQKYTNKKNIVALGGSAGGMLMGFAANEEPELYKAIVTLVPFVDVLNTMLDDSLPLTPGEYKEWGNPKEKQYFDYIKSYCPYQNIKKQNYPHIFATTSISDQRVGYWEAAKWIAKIRENNLSKNKTLLYTDMYSGHSGASSKYDSIQELSKILTFIISLY